MRAPCSVERSETGNMVGVPRGSCFRSGPSCLRRVIPLGEKHLRLILSEYVEHHYHTDLKYYYRDATWFVGDRILEQDGPSSPLNDSPPTDPSAVAEAPVGLLTGLSARARLTRP